MALLHDPIEDDPKLGPLVAKVRRETEADLVAQGYHRGMGFCHVLWPPMRRVLKDKYGIDWKTPSQMNPGALFD